MGLLNDQLAVDAQFAFTDTDAFGETFSYTPRGGAARTVKGVVLRQPAEPLSVVSKTVPFIEIYVPNHATLGVTSVDVDGDSVMVATQYGGTPVKHRIVEIMHQDAGMWHLKLR